MKRLVTLTATTALSLLTLLPGVAVGGAAVVRRRSRRPAARSPLPPVIIFNQKPVFNDYLACVGGYVYTDFRDPDGNDALMWSRWRSTGRAWATGPTTR